MSRSHGTFGPELLHVMFAAYDEAHRQRPQLSPTLVATRIINAAESGTYDFLGLVRAGLGHARASAPARKRINPAQVGA